MACTLIRNGTLIDGNGGQPLGDGFVLIEDGRIKAVGREREVPPPDTEATEIDARGGAIMPGFIDSHVHLMIAGFDFMKLMTTPFSLRFYEAMDSMRRTLECGVTSVRDAGGVDFGIKQAVEQGLVPGPRMQISISVLTITGGHADFWIRSGSSMDLMPPYPGHPGTSLVCDGVDDVRKKTREVLRAGADVIKICSTGGVGSPTDHPEFTQFTPEELEAIVQEGAYRRGIKVMAHAQGPEGIKNAVKAGIHSIEHGIFLDDECIELMLEKGTFLVPTLSAPRGILEAAEATGKVPEWAVRKAKETVEIHSENMKKAIRAGVRTAMGTDAGVIPHGTNLRELGLMCDVGMSPMEAIVASTKTAAECVELGNQVGTLEAGKLADVVIAKNNPLDDIRSLEDLENTLLVMKGGQIVKDGRSSEN
jgi:imidazolonepropionase-like amidohydrolase